MWRSCNFLQGSRMQDVSHAVRSAKRSMASINYFLVAPILVGVWSDRIVAWRCIQERQTFRFVITYWFTRRNFLHWNYDASFTQTYLNKSRIIFRAQNNSYIYFHSEPLSMRSRNCRISIPLLFIFPVSHQSCTNETEGGSETLGVVACDDLYR